MKRISVRDLRQRWPETEKALQIENEIIITRDGKPVAKLVRLSMDQDSRPRWDPVAHARWQRKVNRNIVNQWTDATLTESRSDRRLVSDEK